MPNINANAAWAALGEALAAIQDAYTDMGDARPTYDRLAEMADMSTTTTHTYMTTIPKRPDYTKVAALANALGMSTSVLPQLDTETVQRMDMAEMQDLIKDLREMNIDELARKDKQWREEIDRSNAKWQERFDAEKLTHSTEVKNLTAAHAEEIQRVNIANGTNIERIQTLHAGELQAARESFGAQLEQAREAHKQQLTHMLEAHKSQVEHIQHTAKVQYDSLYNVTTTQKDADERAKAYLKRQVRTWKIVSFFFALALILLLVLDIANPNRGWIKMIGNMKLFSMRGLA